MRRAVFCLFATAFALSAAAPLYSSASIVNAASNQAGPLAPNALASIYGSGLAYVTKTISGSDISGGLLPTVLPGTGVHVNVGGLLASIIYVSPSQINFLVPAFLIPGPVTVQVVRDGLAGPQVTVTLAETSPALFQADPSTVVATRPDGSVLTADSPASAGDWVILYATGLGQTVPPVASGEIAESAASLLRLPNFRLLLDGKAIDPDRIGYAGIAPTYSGLYQINLRLPEGTNRNPEIRIGFDQTLSPPQIRLPVH